MVLTAFALETGDDPDNNANATYEAAKCLEFDSVYAQVDDPKQLDAYLKEVAETSNIDIEDLKRKALSRVEGLIKSFESWLKTKKGKK